MQKKNKTLGVVKPRAEFSCCKRWLKKETNRRKHWWEDDSWSHAGPVVRAEKEPFPWSGEFKAIGNHCRCVG